MGGLWHLTKRFVCAVRPGPPSAADDAWARRHLLPGEIALWERMNNPDRRHAVAVARAVTRELVAAGVAPADRPPDRPVVAAALLHDAGKVVSGLRTPARVAATVFWGVADDGRAARWAAEAAGPPRGIKARLGAYRRHPELGAELLRAADADPLTVAWAAEHHRPESSWTVPVPIGRVLKACDDD
ncbi:MAG: HD domain-containing protein [Actinomycetota bacterium]